MTTSDSLNPITLSRCPFCGGDAQIRLSRVLCKECGIGTQDNWDWSNPIEHSVWQWNARQPSAPSSLLQAMQTHRANMQDDQGRCLGFSQAIEFVRKYVEGVPVAPDMGLGRRLEGLGTYSFAPNPNVFLNRQDVINAVREHFEMGAAAPASVSTIDAESSPSGKEDAAPGGDAPTGNDGARQNSSIDYGGLPSPTPASSDAPDDLKACPFCGNPAGIVNFVKDGNVTGYSAACDICDAEIGSNEPFKLTEEAARHWNMRVADAPAKQPVDRLFSQDQPSRPILTEDSQGHFSGELYERIKAQVLASEIWSPFETAPKDGTEVLVFRHDAGVFTAQFVSPSDMIVSDDDAPCWFTPNGEDLTSDLPTHWMSLPPEPSTGGNLQKPQEETHATP